MKNVTSWSNNDIKTPATWVAPTKTQAQWTNNVVKNAATYTVVPKTASRWNPNTPVNQNYQYDSGDRTYDSPLWFYDSLVNFNTLNQRNVTKWTAN